MTIINSHTVVVTTSDELNIALSEDNNYNYIYLGDNITLSSKITINQNKKNITIDGTYNNTRYTYSELKYIDSTEIITATPTNEYILVKNINIINNCKYGVIYVPQNSNYNNVTTEYNNVTFTGSEMIFNPYGNAKIIDCNITLKRNSTLDCQEVCEANNVEIGGTTTIYSESQNFSLFYFITDAPSPTLKILPNSNVTITNTNKELMSGINNLNFQILKNAQVTLITGNGFSPNSTNGPSNILIDKNATFNFTETKHTSVPMWTIYGNLTLNKNSTLNLMNSYENAPLDNYSIYFKNGSINLNNPKKITIYNKKAQIFYTENSIDFNFDINRINLWTNSEDITTAGTITNLPNYSFYKENENINIIGNFNNNGTIVSSHNLPNINNFNLIDKKQISVGNYNINIFPPTDTIKGYTTPSTQLLINDTQITSDENGYFETPLITLSTTIISNFDNFLYKTRIVDNTHNGELTLMEAPNNITFDLTSPNNKIFPKTKEINLKIVNSTSNNFKLYLKLEDDFNLILPNSLIFKKFDNQIIPLTTNNNLIYEHPDTTPLVNLTYSKEKGLLLDLTNNFLEINKEYDTDITWTVE